ncbi:tetratricopeptide repeat protein [Flavobacteriaceae bacterium TP-CH-4]|uniref:Tetratricopeptide repeat protein n=1 Tax=Pelagihabitans pacificus TaxID=2696054 RepID=A0A967AYG1_9FLAO|nr:tetratricopeptide repeat protein [Pelagihabitans pacificus]NHF58871.1 tetratricopeptide repeat protein [Pelagihabitans pacificus]
MKRILAIILLLTGLQTWAQNEALFDRANDAYNDGKYEMAIEDYLAILDEGQHSAELYFNLGNSYYKLNQIAPSIYYYEKALLLRPDDPEIKNNLSYAQNMTLDAIDALPEMGLSRFYKQITHFLSFDQWAYAAVIFMILFVLLYIAFYYFRYSTRKRIAFILSLVCLMFSITSVVFAFIQYNDFKDDMPAIVFADEVRIQSDPNTQGQEVFRLHEGTKVEVLEDFNEYHKIRIADGKTGWLPKESVKLLKDF